VYNFGRVPVSVLPGLPKLGTRTTPSEVDKKDTKTQLVKERMIGLSEEERESA
jgi:hypothetical protein